MRSPLPIGVVERLGKNHRAPEIPQVVMLGHGGFGWAEGRHLGLVLFVKFVENPDGLFVVEVEARQTTTLGRAIFDAAQAVLDEAASSGPLAGAAELDPKAAGAARVLTALNLSCSGVLQHMLG
jgi:hypothetical protein